VYEWPLFGYDYAVSHSSSVTHFLCFDYGYMVNHSEPSALIPEIGYIFMLLRSRDYGFIRLYDISLTHKIFDTTFTPKP